MGAGTHVLSFPVYAYEYDIERIKVEVDNDVTIEDNWNLICGQGIHPLPLSGNLNISPRQRVRGGGIYTITIVTTVTTKVLIQIDTQVVKK